MAKMMTFLQLSVSSFQRHLLFLLFDFLLRLPYRQHLRQLVVQPVLDAIGDANLMPQAGEGGLVVSLYVPSSLCDTDSCVAGATRIIGR